MRIEEGMATRISALGHERDDGGGVGRSAKGYRSNSVNLAITNISLGQAACGSAYVVFKLVRVFLEVELEVHACARRVRAPSRANAPVCQHAHTPRAPNRRFGCARSSGSVLSRSLVSVGMTLEVDPEYPGTAVRSLSTLHEWPAGCLPICACSLNRWLACGPRASEQCPCRRLR